RCRKTHMPRRATEQRRREILQAALACFSCSGFDAATMAEIRTRARASTGSIYHHFKSKEQIAAELYLEGVRSVQQHGLRALLRHERTEHGIRALVEAYLDWVQQNPVLAAFLFAVRHTDFVRAVERDQKRGQHRILL